MLCFTVKLSLAFDDDSLGQRAIRAEKDVFFRCCRHCLRGREERFDGLQNLLKVGGDGRILGTLG